MSGTKLREAAGRGELLLVNGGLCRFQHRKDGTLLIRELLVLPDFRRQGVGRRLVADVLARARTRIVRVRCSDRGDAAAFWAALGFRAVATTEGKTLWAHDG